MAMNKNLDLLYFALFVVRRGSRYHTRQRFTMMKYFSILFLLLFASLATFAQADPSTPVPCRLKTAEMPQFFGVRLGMPLADARKLYPKARNMAGSSNDPSAVPLEAYSVTTADLPKN